MSYEQKSSRRDHLTSTSKDGKIELTEEQLSRVGGGVHLKYQAALKVRTETFISDGADVRFGQKAKDAHDAGGDRRRMATLRIKPHRSWGPLVGVN